jgi:Alanine racemase, N-terminal domain
MALTLRVDGDRWRAHLDSVLAAVPELVPVAKGNGYGFGLAVLAGTAQRLGVDTLAVGLPGELAEVRTGFAGDVLVLEPFLPGVDILPAPDERVLRTVASPTALDALAGHRVVVELVSSMRRFGLDDAGLAAVAPRLASHRVDGFAVHLPLDQPPGGKVAEVVGVADRLARHGVTAATLWVSHLSDEEVAAAAKAMPDVRLRPRIGTRMWLGSGATRPRATVLAVHELRRGDRYGYRQRRAPRAGHLVVVSGGTSHGIALSAPTGGGLGQRVRVAGAGGLELVGRALSPFRVGDARRWFAEPPHMQVSLLWLPSVEPVPAVGSELDVDVRMTTTTFDAVVVE